MPQTSRTFAAIPPETADVLRPVLSGLADEIIAAIADEVPDYARAMEGEFGQVVRRGVEVALTRFVDRSEEHTSELQSRLHLVCRLLLEKKKRVNSPGKMIRSEDHTS